MSTAPQTPAAAPATAPAPRNAPESTIQKQWRFLRQVARLILWAESRGMTLTGGELYRLPQTAKILAEMRKGIVSSVHIDRMAIDLHLFDQKGNLVTDSARYADLGREWKAMSPDARWGGDFRPVVDGNHFSLEHGGRK